MQSEVQSAKLPVLATVRQALGSVVANRGLALRLTWPWFAVYLVAILAAVVGIAINSGTGTPSPTLIGGAFVFPGVIMVIAFLLSVPAISIGWHRGILRNERPQSPISIDATTWAYLGYYILIGLALTVVNGVLVILVLSVAGISLGLGEGDMSIQRLAAIAPYLQLASIPGLIMVNRLIMVLPGRAVGEPVSFAKAWRNTRGNTLRLTLGGGLVMLPFIVIQGLAQISMIAAPMSALATGLGFLTLLALIFCSLGWLSFISMSYAKLTPEPAAA